jgi:hypothetical protein
MPMRRDPAKAIAVLDAMLEFFDGGRRWTRWKRIGPKDRRCLMGALGLIREQHLIQSDGTEHYLREITGTQPGKTKFGLNDLDLMNYNDHCQSFRRLRALIVAARALAQAELAATA